MHPRGARLRLGNADTLQGCSGCDPRRVAIRVTGPRSDALGGASPTTISSLGLPSTLTLHGLLQYPPGCFKFLASGSDFAVLHGKAEVRIPSQGPSVGVLLTKRVTKKDAEPHA